MLKHDQNHWNNHDLQKSIPHVVGRSGASTTSQQLDTTFVNFGNLPFPASKKTTIS